MISEVHSDKVARLATVRRSWREICRKKLTERHSWTDIFRLRIERTEICRKSKRTRVNKWKSEAKSACGRDDWAARKRSDSNLLDSTRNTLLIVHAKRPSGCITFARSIVCANTICGLHETNFTFSTLLSQR